MKKLLDSNDKAVVRIFDEVTLWSAPFGRLLLDNIPMKQAATIVDIGFGTGFPLIELSQRFGEQSKVYGVDIWKEGINRAQLKIDVLELKNIEILEKSAPEIAIADNQIDLVTSNLGVNNFDEKEIVYLEIKRILKKGGRFCLTTNPGETFKAFFALFAITLEEFKQFEGLTMLANYLNHRTSEKAIVTELEQKGLKLVKSKSDTANIRFVGAEALLNHSLIRIGFRAYWEKMIKEESRAAFFEKLIAKINTIIEAEGAFVLTIPLLYLEFEKE